MSDNLEKFIRNNRTAFDTEVPPAKIWENIKQNVPIQKKKNSIIGLNRRFLWAAAAMLVFTLSIILYQANTINTLKNSVATSGIENTEWQVPIELQDLDNMYVEQVTETMELLQDFPEEATELRLELQELDAEFEDLKTELGADYSSEEVLEAMIDNYRIKLNLLESTLEHLRRSNKIIEDENTIL